jgi:checkpoint serine/threonine-protein kinase
MTLHTKEAMDEIYGIFNEPLKNQDESVTETQSGDESSDDDEDAYTSGGESTGTGGISCATSEFGDETTAADFTLGTTVLDHDDVEEETEGDDTDAKSVSAWSDFTESKHVPKDRQQDGSDDENEHSEDDSFDDQQRQADPEDQYDAELITPTSPGAPAYQHGSFQSRQKTTTLQCDRTEIPYKLPTIVYLS